MNATAAVSEQPLQVEQAGHRGVPAGVDSIGAAIRHWAERQPDRPAMVDTERSLTWAELQADVQAMGAALSRFGIGPSHRVGLLVPEGMAGARLVLGLCAHCLLVPVGPALAKQELSALAAETRLDALVVPQSLDRVVDADAMGGLLLLEHRVAAGDVPMLHRLDGCLSRGNAEGPSAPAGAALLLRSSGSTGHPKLVPVTHRNMLTMAARMASPEWFGLGTSDRAACLLPLYYAAGLKNLLLVPVLLGGSVAFPPAGRAFQIAAWLADLKPTFFCSTPTTLRSMVERLDTDITGSSLRFIMCGAFYVPDTLRLAAEAAFGVPIVEYYGLSEAGVVTANPLQPGAARPGTVGRPAGGDLTIVDAQGRPLPAGEVGEIAVSGPGVCPGYVLPDGTLSDDLRQGRLLTGDVGLLDPDNFLHIHGRVKEVINRGGEKVFPYEVEKALLEHDDVLEAAVYGVPHPRLGQSVGAAVVLKPGRTATAREIGAWLSARLAAYKVPRGLRIVSALPRGSTGKVQRQQLAQIHHEPAALRAPGENPLQEELLGMWRRMLGTDDVGIDDDFIDMGGDSLQAVDLLLQVEQLTGVSSARWDLSSLTVRGVMQAVLRTLDESRSELGDVLLQVRRGHGPPLFFCHGDFVARGIYAHRIVDLLDAPNPVWMVNAPERQNVLSIEATAAEGADEMMRIGGGFPEGVYIAGWCNGGVVAWHLAHLLRARGVRVHALFLMETPSLNGGGWVRAIAQGLRHGAGLVPGRAGRFLRDRAMRGAWAFQRKSLSEFAAAFQRRVLGTRPHEASDPRDSMRPRGPSARAVLLYERIARYVPSRLDVPVTCILAEHGVLSDTDPARWAKLAPEVRTVVVPGDHSTAVYGHRATLAAQLSMCLREAPGAAA